MFPRSDGLIALIGIALLCGCDNSAQNTPAPKSRSGTQAPAGQSPAAPNNTAGPLAAEPPPSPTQPKPPAPKPPPSTATGPKWDMENVVYNFGEVWAGKQVRHPFEFHNTGDRMLKIQQPKARCSCSVAENYTREVPPDGTGFIPFLLNTANKSGPVDEWLSIGTNDPLRPEMKIWMRGLVKSVCTLEVVADGSIASGARNAPGIEALKKRQAHFGTITANQSLYRVIRMTNATGTPLSLELLDSPRALLKVKSDTQVIPSPFNASIEEIEPGQVFELTITSKPPFQVGTTTLGINFRTNIPDRAHYAVAATAYVPPRIEVRPYKIVTNLQANTKLRTIRIINHGTTPYEITSFATSSPDYQLSRVPPAPNEPNTDKFELMLPAGNYVPPTYGEMIRFETTDTRMPVIEIPVLPHLRNSPTPRPDNQPIQWYPGKQ